MVFMESPPFPGGIAYQRAQQQGTLRTTASGPCNEITELATALLWQIQHPRDRRPAVAGSNLFAYDKAKVEHHFEIATIAQATDNSRRTLRT